MEQFAIWGAGIGAVGAVIVNIMQGKVPGIGDMIPPAVGGAIVAAMIYIFYSSTR